MRFILGLSLFLLAACAGEAAEPRRDPEGPYAAYAGGELYDCCVDTQISIFEEIAMPDDAIAQEEARRACACTRQTAHRAALSVGVTDARAIELIQDMALNGMIPKKVNRDAAMISAGRLAEVLGEDSEGTSRTIQRLAEAILTSVSDACAEDARRLTAAGIAAYDEAGTTPPDFVLDWARANGVDLPAHHRTAQGGLAERTSDRLR